MPSMGSTDGIGGLLFATLAVGVALFIYAGDFSYLVAAVIAVWLAATAAKFIR